MIKFKDDEVGELESLQKKKMLTKFCLGNLKDRRCEQDLGIDVKLLLKDSLKKYN
jgi:hypothetical protein